MKATFLALLVLLLAAAAVIVIALFGRSRNDAPVTVVARDVAPATSALAATDANDPLGIPVCRDRKLQVISKPYFTVGYDNVRKEPAWVSYAVAGPIKFHGREHRPDRFKTDSEVSNPATHEDYTHSGYDRGHMAPAYAMFSRFGPEAMNTTFVTSNICPQLHSLNAGRWENLESLIAGRENKGDGWAGEFGQVWITDGPIFNASDDHLGGGEEVPRSFFMIVLRREGERYHSMAFEMPNAEVRESAEHFLVSIRRIELDTGIDFDPMLTGKDADRFEIEPAVSLWP